MHSDIDAIERIIIDTFSSAHADRSAITRETEVQDLLDSIGLVIALADAQAALEIELEPDEVIEVLQSRTLADIAAVFDAASRTRRV